MARSAMRRQPPVLVLAIDGVFAMPQVLGDLLDRRFTALRSWCPCLRVGSGWS